MERGTAVELQLGDLKGFAVHPKTDCPHVKVQNINATHKLFDTLRGLLIPGVCKQCGSQEENWICLCCNGVFCSRYCEGHMAEHNTTSKHEVALSFTDGSVWCYECNSYITSAPLNYLAIKFSSIKFPDGNDQESMEQLTKILENSLEIGEKKQKKEEPLFKNVNNEEPKKNEEHQNTELHKEVGEPQLQKKSKYTKERLIEDIKYKKVKKIVFLTGAGISVSAGIPDFRSPNSGIYNRLAAYNLPIPEAVFDINFFKKNPEPFYKLSKELFSVKVTPTISHRFIKKLHEEEQLLKTITQNIDSLEILAGLPSDKLIQAHGHSRTIHCMECCKDIPLVDFEKSLEEDKILRCQCGGLAKPNIVFFGESLPTEFSQAPQIVQDADLVIVMGTSLMVFPFAYLIQLVRKDIPIVLINNTNSLGLKFPNALWLDGDLDQQIVELCEALAWKL